MKQPNRQQARREISRELVEMEAQKIEAQIEYKKEMAEIIEFESMDYPDPLDDGPDDFNDFGPFFDEGEDDYPDDFDDYPY